MMLVQATLNSTDVRNNWGGFIDEVVRFRPHFVKRNRDHFVAISAVHLATLLAPFRPHFEYTVEADGSFSGALREIDLVATALNLAALRQALAKELIEYANEYWEDPDYFRAPNRKAHMPYVLHVLIQRDGAAVAGLLDA